MGEEKKKKAYKEEENWSLKFPVYLQGSNLHKACYTYFVPNPLRSFECIL